MDLINGLRNQIRENNAFDILNMQKLQREFENELKFKRTQVEQLMEKLDESNRQNYELKRTVEKCESSNKELQMNLGVLKKKTSILEDRNKELSEALMEAQMKQQLAVSEVDTIKAYAHRVAMENYELTKKTERLEAEKNYNSSFQNDVLEKETKIDEIIQIIKDLFLNLQEEQGKVLQVEQFLNENKEKLELSKYSMEEVQSLRQEKGALELNLLKLNARNSQMEELLNANSALTKPDFITKLIFDKWKSSSEFYRKSIENNEEIIKALTEKLKQSEETNLTLIKQIEENEEKNHKKE